MSPVSAEEQHWFAVAAPGLEPMVRQEISALPGARLIRAVPGGIEFSGPLEVGMAANLELRVASRILLRLGQVDARFRTALQAGLAALPFERWIAPGSQLRIDVTAHRCRLYHTGLIDEVVRAAVVARLDATGKGAGTSPARAAGGPVRIAIRGERDRWQVSIDASGELLHRRGWRLEAGPAPLRETLAAGILRLGAYDPGLPLVDPMCGSGTFVLEAAAVATGRAPGLGRSFAFESWPAFAGAGQVRWRALTAAAAARVRAGSGAALLGWDASAKAVAIAARNADRAGLSAVTRFESWRFSATPPADWAQRRGGRPGLVVCNPPYGKRLGGREQARRTIAALGQNLPAWFPGWQAAVIVPDARWAPLLALVRPSVHPVDNGGLEIHVVTGAIAKPAPSPVANR